MTGPDSDLSDTGDAASFRAYAAGIYTIEVVASDGLYSSLPATLTLQAFGADQERPGGPGFCECRLTGSSRPSSGALLLLALLMSWIGFGSRRRR